MLLGIDFGTSNICVSYIDSSHRVKVLPLGQNSNSMPSVVSISGKDIFIGEAALHRSIEFESDTIFDLKRIIGRRFEDAEVQNFILKYPIKIFKQDNNEISVVVDNKAFSPEKLLSYILLHIKKCFFQYTGEKAEQAYISVPSFFNNVQRKAIIEAGKIAELKIEKLISEPVAAAVAYDYSGKSNRVIAVYDLGGGSFDFSILQVKGSDIFSIASYGDTYLGGEDIDHKLFEHVCQDMWTKCQVYVKDSPFLTDKILRASQKVKEELSLHRSIKMNIPFLKNHQGSIFTYEKNIERDLLQTMSKSLINQTISTIDRCMHRAALKKTDLDDVILVGGQCKMPYLMDTMAYYFGRTPAKIIQADQVIAAGLALKANEDINQKKSIISMIDILPQSMSSKKRSRITKIDRAKKDVQIEYKHNVAVKRDQAEPQDNTLSFRDPSFDASVNQINNNEDKINKKQIHDQANIKSENTLDMLKKYLDEKTKKAKSVYYKQRNQFTVEQAEKVEKIFSLVPALLEKGDKKKIMLALESLSLLEGQLR